MSLEDRDTRQAFWRAQPALVARAIMTGHDINQAYELVHAAALRAAGSRRPHHLAAEAWLDQVFAEAAADTPSTPEIRSA